MLMKNPTKNPVVIEDLGLAISPDGTAEVEDSLCQARQAQNGFFTKGILAMLAPQLIPADEKLVEAYRNNTLVLVDPVVATPGPLSYAEVAGMAPAVRALVAEGAEAVPPKQPKQPQLTHKQQAAKAAEDSKKSFTP